MIAHILTHLIRVSQRNRLYTAIHIIGLSVGLAVCLLIALFVRHELSYDLFWPDVERIYQVQTEFRVPGRDSFLTSSAMGPAKAALVQDFPQVENAARIVPMDAVVTRRQGEKLTVLDDAITLIDPEFLDLFPQVALAGEINRYRGDASSLIVTHSFAEKYFGQDSPLNQELEIKMGDLKRTYRIVALIADPPTESHMTWRAFAFVNESDFLDRPWLFASWTSVNAYTYIKIKSDARIETISAATADFINRHFPAIPLGDPDTKAADMVKLTYMNATDVHLHTVGRGGFKPRGNYRTVMALAAIAGLILVIACINFVNLSTARATRRAKEISLRKVLGASRPQLILQLMGEAVAQSLIALFFALCLVELSVHHIGEWMNRNMEASLSSHPTMALWGLILAIVVGLAGGLYPALVISGFRPVRVLKSSYSSEARGQTRLRLLLVFVQFLIASALIICTGTLYAQTIFARHKDLGFQKDELLIMRGLDAASSSESARSFLDALERVPGVVSVANLDFAPLDNNENNTVLRRLGDTSTQGNVLIGHRPVDDGFLRAFDIPLLAGRNFDRHRAGDRYPSNDELKVAEQPIESVLILNLSALRRFGFATPEEALHQRLEMPAIGDVGVRQPVFAEVIGVIPDLHLDSLRQTIRPEVYVFPKKHLDVVTIRFAKSEMAGLSESLGEIWRTWLGSEPLRLEFVDTLVVSQYDEEEKLARLFAVAAGVAIVVACLGLFGLASFTAERKTKEIGLRKVMGATANDIVRLLIQQFSKPVLIANLIGCPIALYLMQDWLNGFQYRIDLSTTGTMLAIGSVVINLGIAWGTVAFHCIRIANANPIHALRYE